MPDRHTRLGLRRIRRRRRAGRNETLVLPGDHGDGGVATRSIGVNRAGDVLGPQHREVRVDHLVGGWQVHPDLEQLDGVRPVLVDQRKHLAVHHTAASGHPLHIAAAEARRCAERVAVVDVPLAGERHRFEATVRMLGETGHGAAVVHPPAVTRLEVVAESAAGE